MRLSHQHFTHIILYFLWFALISIPVKINAETIENEYLIVQFEKNGALSFKDKLHDVEWGSQFPGWAYLSNGDVVEKMPLSSSEFTATTSGKTITFRFQGIRSEKLNDPNFLFMGNITLDADQFELEISKVQTDLIFRDVEFPAHILDVQSGIQDAYVVVPHLQGILIPSRYDAGFMRYGQNIWDIIADQEKWWAFESGNLNMPWFGASKNTSTVMAQVGTSSDCVLHVLGNALVGDQGFVVDVEPGAKNGTRLSSLTPIWKASKRKLRYPRKMTISLVDNGYIGMAKKYKEHAIASGRYVTLKEKIASNPEYEKIIGAPDIKIYCYTNRIDSTYLRAWSEPVLNGYTKVNTSFAEVEKIAQDLVDMGVEKSLVLLSGWNRMGYDRELVDVWPPAEPAGGKGGLIRASEAVTQKGFLFALHDNYDDYYPDAPTYDEKYILRDSDGTLHTGGVWDGGLCHIICPAMREELLNRNMSLIQENLSINGYYLDVLTNTSHYECYDLRHPITRSEDLQHRFALLQNMADRGLVIGGERGTDWAMPLLAFCEGLSGGGADYHRGVGYRTGLTVPLFYMVYRECVVGYWQHGTPYGREDHSNHVLLDLLHGQPSSWSLSYDQWNDLKPMIKQTYELLGTLHSRTAHESMINHEILTNDHMVQKSEFEKGTTVWVNFGITTYNDEEISIPPKGFILAYPEKDAIKGIVSRDIKYIE